MTPAIRLRSDESGFTLVEVVIAITIMGILFIAVFGALAVFLKTTAVQRATSDLDTTARSFAEVLTGVAYQPCVGSVAPAYIGSGPGKVAAPAGYGVTLTFKYWDGTNGAPPSNNFKAPTSPAVCPTTDNGVQQITITMTRNVADAPDKQTQVLVIAKREII